jgi:hypothetical protein
LKPSAMSLALIVSIACVVLIVGAVAIWPNHRS